MNEKKEFSKWWFLILVLVVLSSIVFTVINYAGIYGHTVVERKVFEASYQKTASDEKRLSTYEAQLSQIQSRLRGNVNEQTKQDLEAQKAMLQVQINSMR